MSRTCSLPVPLLLRQLQAEDGAAAVGVAGGEIAVLGAGEGVGDREAQTRASARTGAGRFGPVEAVEDPRQVLRWNAGTRSLDARLRPVVVELSCPDGYVSPFGRVTYSVVQ